VLEAWWRGTKRRRLLEQSGRGEVEATVLRDEDRAVRRERGAVRTTARVRELLRAVLIRLDPIQRALGNTGHDQGVISTPHRAFGELDPVANDHGLHVAQSGWFCMAGHGSTVGRSSCVFPATIP
jgi:hypothetical protein